MVLSWFTQKNITKSYYTFSTNFLPLRQMLPGFLMQCLNVFLATPKLDPIIIRYHPLFLIIHVLLKHALSCFFHFSLDHMSLCYFPVYISWKGSSKILADLLTVALSWGPNMLLLKQVFTHEIDVQLIITHMLLKSLRVRNSPLNLWLCIFLGRKNLWKSILWKSCYGLFDLFGENGVTVFNTLLLTLIYSNGTHLQARLLMLMDSIFFSY